MMHNPKLLQASDTIWSDNDRLIEQRCVFLFQGFPDNVDWNPNLPIPEELDALRLKFEYIKPD